jgi:hypothetical protein
MALAATIKRPPEFPQGADGMSKTTEGSKKAVVISTEAATLATGAWMNRNPKKFSEYPRALPMSPRWRIHQVWIADSPQRRTSRTKWS